MKFLLDMGLARSTRQFLQSEGHDAVHSEFADQLDESVRAEYRRLWQNAQAIPRAE
jgi:predicted nuclease of predicted toxin-antitoxin system